MFTSKEEKPKKALAKQGYVNPQDALFEAAKKGDVTGIDNAIQTGVDVDAKDELGRTVLYTAALNGRTAAIDALIRHGADVHAKASNGSTALTPWFGMVQMFRLSVIVASPPWM